MIVTIKKFSRPGCRPCAILFNWISEINLEAHGANLVEIDITEQPEVIEQYGLTSVPVLVFERSGVEVHRIVGLRPTEEIIDAIEHAKVAK